MRGAGLPELLPLLVTEAAAIPDQQGRGEGPGRMLINAQQRGAQFAAPDRQAACRAQRKLQLFCRSTGAPCAYRSRGAQPLTEQPALVVETAGVLAAAGAAQAQLQMQATARRRHSHLLAASVMRHSYTPREFIVMRVEYETRDLPLLFGERRNPAWQFVNLAVTLRRPAIRQPRPRIQVGHGGAQQHGADQHAGSGQQQCRQQQQQITVERRQFGQLVEAQQPGHKGQG